MTGKKPNSVLPLQPLYIQNYWNRSLPWCISCSHTPALALQLTTRCAKNKHGNDRAVLNADFPGLLPNTQRGYVLRWFLAIHSKTAEEVTRVHDMARSITPSPPMYTLCANAQKSRSSVAAQTWLRRALLFSWCVMEEQKDIDSGKSHWRFVTDARWWTPSVYLFTGVTWVEINSTAPRDLSQSPITCVAAFYLNSIPNLSSCCWWAVLLAWECWAYSPLCFHKPAETFSILDLSLQTSFPQATPSKFTVNICLAFGKARHGIVIP